MEALTRLLRVDDQHRNELIKFNHRDRKYYYTQDFKLDIETTLLTM